MLRGTWLVLLSRFFSLNLRQYRMEGFLCKVSQWLFFRYTLRRWTLAEGNLCANIVRTGISSCYVALIAFFFRCLNANMSFLKFGICGKAWNSHATPMIMISTPWSELRALNNAKDCQKTRTKKSVGRHGKMRIRTKDSVKSCHMSLRRTKNFEL